LTDTETISVQVKEEYVDETTLVVRDSSPFSCTCIACTAFLCKDASSAAAVDATSTTTTSLCPLYKYGCLHCYDLWYNHHRKKSNAISNVIALSDSVPITAITTSTSNRTCLFRCCIRESREVKDQYACELDRILSSFTNTSTVAITSSRNSIPANGTLQRQQPQVLPIGTVVLCCWHLNGVRTRTYYIVLRLFIWFYSFLF
jgi:hypothetical protein